MTIPRRLLFAIVLLSTLSTRADLIWSPETGWRSEGGVLSPLAAPGEDSRGALDMMNKARAAEEKHDTGGAAALYESVAKQYPHSIYAGEALFRAGNLRLARRQYVPAFEHYDEAVKEHPDTPHFDEIIGQEYTISSALIDGARGYWWGVIPGFTNRRQGVEYGEAILKAAPSSEYAPLVLMNVARGHQKLGDKDDAKDALDRLISNYPRSLLAPDAYLRLAQAYAADVQGPEYDQGATKQAITYFEDFTLQFPKDPNVPAAAKGVTDLRAILAKGKIQIADFYFYKRDNFVAARVFYNAAITISPDSAEAVLARQRLAEVDKVEATYKPRKKFLGIF
jgi:outer membrane protein assembly factor BamD